MDANEYQYRALRTCIELYDTKTALVYGALGLAGESGEVAEIIKKWAFHGHLFNKQELEKELGDVAWYLAIAAHKAGLSLNEVLEHNLEKLEKRYPDGYSSERSVSRDEGTAQEIEFTANGEDYVATQEYLL